MKSMVASALLVLLAVVLFAAGDSLSSEKPVRAPIPEARPDSPEDRDFFLSRADERDREPRPERPAPRRRDRERPQMHERPPMREPHREHPRPAEHRELERDLDQQRHRIQNMHVAAEHLEQAGLHDLAHRIHQEANETEQNLRQRMERHRHPEHHPPHFGPEIREMFEQLRNEVRELKNEVRELRETVTRQARRPEK